jgi:hypothetical protein
MRERYVIGKTKGMSVNKLRGNIVDESENVSANIDALATAETTLTEVIFGSL